MSSQNDSMLVWDERPPRTIEIAVEDKVLDACAAGSAPPAGPTRRMAQDVETDPSNPQRTIRHSKLP